MRLEDENIQDIAPFGVRMPSALKAKIKAAAKANRHSMNAEIVERLEASFSTTGTVNQEKILQAAMIKIIIATAKVFDKKGLEWPEIQNNLIESLDEISDGITK